MATYQMARGDYKEDYPCIEKSGWTPGGKLFFVVKSQLDNNADDSGAVIDVVMTDGDIVDSNYSANGKTYVRYRCIIRSDMTQNYAMSATKQKLITEYQYVNSNGNPTTWPQFTLTLFKDANRRRT